MHKHGESFADFDEFLDYLMEELETLPSDKPWNITITNGRTGVYSVRVTRSDEEITL